MPNLEKVIQGLEHCGFTGKRGCAGCPYSNECGDFGREAGTGSLCTDALALLREQELVTIKPYYFNYVCSGCKSEIDGEFIEYTGGKIKFCPWCGRAVKWDA